MLPNFQEIEHVLLDNFDYTSHVVRRDLASKCRQRDAIVRGLRAHVCLLMSSEYSHSSPCRDTRRFKISITARSIIQLRVTACGVCVIHILLQSLSVVSV